MIVNTVETKAHSIVLASFDSPGFCCFVLLHEFVSRIYLCFHVDSLVFLMWTRLLCGPDTLNI